MTTSPCSTMGQIRLLFALAATVVTISVVLAVTVSPWWVLLALFVAANQYLFAIVGSCPSSWLLRRVCARREVTQ